MTKRVFDIAFSLMAIVLLFPVLLISLILASADTNSTGIFLQERIGRLGKPFTIFKLRTMHSKTGNISGIGTFFRKFKLDELPQLFNVLLGNMSVVGPRPDISGYYDNLKGEAYKILELKPGLTSLATIKYANEEAILLQQENPLLYNDTVLFPDKVKLNLDYYYHHSFFGDIKIIWQTVLMLFS
ncbi:MAG: sugar transferase [Lutibacter sp.]|jgi:lipopolysaccharide/colanic/teichoic acid biosynthesis glycosyltransferase